jgi:hypothetical protein
MSKVILNKLYKLFTKSNSRYDKLNVIINILAAGYPASAKAFTSGGNFKDD